MEIFDRKLKAHQASLPGPTVLAFSRIHMEMDVPDCSVKGSRQPTENILGARPLHVPHDTFNVVISV